MIIVVKEVDKKQKIVEVNERYVTNCGKKFINDYPQKVALGNGLYLLVDDSGLQKELPVNFLLGFKNDVFPIQKMVGTVVFVRIKPAGCGEIYDFEIDDLNMHDLTIIDTILNEKYQDKLKKNFVDYGKGYFIVKELI